MCSRMWDNPAPRCSSSSMLPVAHHACTLATGALWSSCTMRVSPLGKIHFSAVLGGNEISAEDSGGAAFKLTMVNNRAAARKLATGMRYITQIYSGEARMPNHERKINDEALKEPDADAHLLSFELRH